MTKPQHSPDWSICLSSPNFLWREKLWQLGSECGKRVAKV